MSAMLLRAEGVAAILDICRAKAYRMMATGELPVVRIGGSVRVDRRALAKWIRSKAAGPVSTPAGNDTPAGTAE